MSDSTFLRHEPCPSCGSSDSLARYSDGHAHCFSLGCKHHEKSEGEPTRRTKIASDLLTGWEFQALPKRKITEETCRKWGYGVVDYKGKKAHVANLYDLQGSKIVAQKIRLPGKEFLTRGDLKQAGLYGQHLWRDGGKMVVLTEGELDALSVSQVQDNRWPVSSIPNGASGAKQAIQRSLEWLEKFERVVFMFDNDDAGKAAAVECSEMLTPGKAFIAALPLKDASDMLQAGRVKEMIDAIWSAKEFRPDGIVAGTEIVDRVLNKKEEPSVPYPWASINTLLRGVRRGEIVTFCAGTGIGKSQVCKEIIYHMHETTNEKFGIVCLEESVEKTGLILASLALGKRVSVDRSLTDKAELREALQKTVGSGRFYLYDHFGSLESDNLLGKIRYLVKGCGCDTILLDHISIVVSGNEADDERKAIDVLMTNLRSFVQEVNCRMLIVSHLKRPEKKGHEEGARTSLNQLRGSGGIGQMSDIVVGLERDQQDESVKDQTTLRVLKNRYTGELGEAGTLVWDKETGRLSEYGFETATAGSEL
jgi:twinkle protein